MAEGSAEERTLPATPRRRQKAREEGQILRSRELSSTAVLVGGGAVLFVAGGSLYHQIVSLLSNGLSLSTQDMFNTAAMFRHCLDLAGAGAMVLAQFFSVVMLCAVAGSIAIGGWSLTAKRIFPDSSRLNPIEGIRKLLSAQGLGELAKSIVKLLVVAGISALVLWRDYPRIDSLLLASPRDAVVDAGRMLVHLFLCVAAATVLVLLVDVPLQIYQYSKQLRMTPQEVREEMKETEGHPDVKRRVRRLQQEQARGRMMAAVPAADVIITNPTHFAVALRYQPDKRSAPIVVAKGINKVALRIRELAAEQGVPVLESPRLARALYRHVPLEGEIPGVLYQAVAQVLAYVYQLKSGAVPQPPSNIDVPDRLLGGETV